jgi:hypothetical protein
MLMGINDNDSDDVRPFLMLFQYMISKPTTFGGNDVTDMLMSNFFS